MTCDDGSNPRDSVEYSCNEARETINQQIKKIHREDEKAIRMARVNLVIVGTFVGSFSLIFQNKSTNALQFINAHNGLGMFFVLVSTILAGMTYTSSSFEMGISSEAIEDAQDMTTGDFFEEVSDKYSDWINKNNNIHKMNSYAIEWVIMLAIVGVIFLIGGFTVGFIGIRGDILSYGILIGEFIVSFIISILISKSDKIFEIVLADE